MDKDIVAERCNLAINGLRVRIGKHPSKELLAITEDAINKISERMVAGFESEESLDIFIWSIWSKILPVIKREKRSIKLHSSAGENVIQNIISTTTPAQKECRWCDHGCFARTPFGCPFKCGEPPHCVGFVWDKKGEIW